MSAHHAVEFYGTSIAPRVRWTCPKCLHRNDTKLQPPLHPREPVVCRKCKRADVARVLEAKAP